MAVRPDPASGQWVTLAQATGLLGVSDRTLRRQIAASELRTQRTGGRRLVWVSTPDTLTNTIEAVAAKTASNDGQFAAVAVETASTADGAAMAANHNALAATLKEWRSLLEAERQRASTAEQAAAMWQERARNLEAENAQLEAEREQLREQLVLPPHSETPLPVTGTPAPVSSMPVPDRTVRPWWVFWRRRAASRWEG